MNAQNPHISLAKQADGTIIFSTTPFDPTLEGDVLAFPRVSQQQLDALKHGTPQMVQQILQSLANI